MGIGVNSIIKRNSIQIIFDESSLFFIFFYFGTLKFTKKKKILMKENQKLTTISERKEAENDKILNENIKNKENIYFSMIDLNIYFFLYFKYFKNMRNDSN